jgi:hypothetical protein
LPNVFLKRLQLHQKSHSTGRARARARAVFSGAGALQNGPELSSMTAWGSCYCYHLSILFRALMVWLSMHVHIGLVNHNLVTNLLDQCSFFLNNPDQLV